jgi:DNA repair protein RadD
MVAVAPKLRPYQATALALLDDRRAEGSPSVLLVSPTGSGKGTIAAYLAAREAQAGRRVLFTAPLREIVEDTAKRCLAWGAPSVCVRIGDPVGPLDAPVQLATIQTLAARGDLPPCDLLITDEAHHATTATHRDVAAALGARFHVGLTATPARSDGTALGDVYDRLIEVVTLDELVADGYLAPIVTLRPPRPADGALAEDPIVAYERFAGGRRAVVFTRGVKAARDLACRFSDDGHPAEVVSGDLPVSARRRALERFEAGEIVVLVNDMVLTEGWDCPAAEVVILARGCTSVATYLQCIGRVRRPHAGKRSALLIDLPGVVHVHGLPDEAREWALSGKPIRRATSLKPWQCMACGLCVAERPLDRVCPRCAEPVPVTPREAARIRRQELLANAPIVPRSEKRPYFDQLLAEQKAKGHKPSWIGMKFKARFGHWPPWPLPGFKRAS